LSKQGIVKRVEKLETKSTDPRFKVAIADMTGAEPVYSGDCGNGVTWEQYNVWLQTLTFDDQLIVIEIVPNAPVKATVDRYAAHTLVNLQNNAGKNTKDLLKDYAELFPNGEIG